MMLSALSRRCASALLLAALTLLAASCAKLGGPPPGMMDLRVVNDGDFPVEDIRVLHGPEAFEVPFLMPGDGQRTRITFDPENSFRLRYRTLGRDWDESYKLRALRTHGGEMIIRFGRDGEAELIERFYVRD